VRPIKTQSSPPISPFSIPSHHIRTRRLRPPSCCRSAAGSPLYRPLRPPCRIQKGPSLCVCVVVVKRGQALLFGAPRNRAKAPPPAAEQKRTSRQCPNAVSSGGLRLSLERGVKGARPISGPGPTRSQTRLDRPPLDRSTRRAPSWHQSHSTCPSRASKQASKTPLAA
jgi:hypothetical protein